MQLLALLAVLFAVLWPAAGRADPSPAALCRAAIGAAERATGVPDRLMQAIGIVESGRPDERGGVSAWPWTINVEGVGYTFDTKQQAIQAVEAHRARGARSIDVGCMQVNLMYHGQAFATLEQAFDPAANARYAADFLQKLLTDTGSWPRAAAAYHSMTPDIGAEYARKVLAVWARPGLGDSALAPFRRGPMAANLMPPATAITSQPRIATAAPPPQPLPPAPGGLAMSGSLTARVLPSGGGGIGASAGITGRGLSAYRAAPTRLATATVLPRS